MRTSSILSTAAAASLLIPTPVVANGVASDHAPSKTAALIGAIDRSTTACVQAPSGHGFIITQHPSARTQSERLEAHPKSFPECPPQVSWTSGNLLLAGNVASPTSLTTPEAPDVPMKASGNNSVFCFNAKRRDALADVETSCSAIIANTVTSKFDMAEALFRRGQHRYWAHDYEAAFSDLAAGLSLNPRHAGLHARIGYIFYFAGDYDRAFAEGTEAIALKRNNATAHVLLAQTERERGNAAQYHLHLTKALEIEPGIVWAHRMQMYDLLAKGMPEAALEKSLLMLKLPRENFSDENTIKENGQYFAEWQGTIVEHASILAGLNRYPEALAVLDREIATSPNGKLYYIRGHTIGKSLLNLPKPLAGYDALADYRKAVELDATIHSAWNEIAIKLSADFPRESYEANRRAIQLVQQSAGLKIDINDSSEAQEATQQIIASSGRFYEAAKYLPRYYWHMAAIYRNLGKVDAALKSAHVALRIGAINEDHFYKLIIGNLRHLGYLQGEPDLDSPVLMNALAACVHDRHCI